MGVRGVLRRSSAPPGGAVDVDASDRFLVSYPRSGNTWARFLLASALFPDRSIDFATIGQLIPDVYVDTRRTIRRAPRPRLLKSHEAYDARYGRVIYVVRHPADVAVSYYHFRVKMRYLREGFDFGRYLDAFLTGPIDEIGSWGDHVRGWLDARGADGDFLVVRYEDMAADPAAALRRMLDHLGAPAEDERVATAVERSSADEMRRLEQRSAAHHRDLRHSRLDKAFVRRAVVGSATQELGPELLARVAAVWPDVLERVGYGAAPPATAKA